MTLMKTYLSCKRALGIVSVALISIASTIGTVALVSLVPTISSSAEESQWGSDNQWKLGGQNLNNTRYQAGEKYLSPQNVTHLSPKWVFSAGGELSATPAVVDKAVYMPDWGGNFFKLDAQTGTPIWANTIAGYINDPSIPKAVARTNPAIKGNKVIIGSQEGAFLIAVNKDTGKLIWKTKLDEHPYATITQSPTIYGNRVYVGVSSQEETVADDPNYPCCTFRGSMTAVDLNTGKLLWKTYTIPENYGQSDGYSGGAVWGSTPAIDPKRNLVYIATGNNYNVPQAVKNCVAKLSSQIAPDVSPCLAPDNYIDAIMALDLDTGAIKWANKLQGYDTWTVACISGSLSNCPDPKGEDYDFGQAPMLFTVKDAGKSRDLVGAGQKSGVFWALDPDTGKVVWSRIVGPGGDLGGMQWGSATDSQQIYVAISNNGRKPYTLEPSGETINGGSWSALDAATGKIIWQTADPAGAVDLAPMTVANGVVYAGSTAAGADKNNMYALDAKTGKTLWSFNSGGSVGAGAAVVDGTVYWGSGYTRPDPTLNLTPNNQFYAFTVLKPF